MKHNMKILLTRDIREAPILETQTQMLSRRLWNLVFGRRRKVVILIPGDTVEAVEVIEQPPAV